MNVPGLSTRQLADLTIIFLNAVKNTLIRESKTALKFSYYLLDTVGSLWVTKFNRPILIGA